MLTEAYDEVVFDYVIDFDYRSVTEKTILYETCSNIINDIPPAFMHQSKDVIEGVSHIPRCKYMQRKQLLQLIALFCLHSFKRLHAEMCLISTNSIGVFMYSKSAA